MTKFQKMSLFFMRVGIGWMMFYSGITKVLNPEWSSVGYLRGAKTFVGFYQWLASTGVLPFSMKIFVKAKPNSKVIEILYLKKIDMI